MIMLILTMIMMLVSMVFRGNADKDKDVDQDDHDKNVDLNDKKVDLNGWLGVTRPVGVCRSRCTRLFSTKDTATRASVSGDHDGHD